MSFSTFLLPPSTTTTTTTSKTPLLQREKEMGNCQAIDAATLVIQYPCGKAEKLYWPVSASEVMKTNPGHYVALLITTTLCPTTGTASTTADAPSSVRITRVKLLRPTDTLVLGQVYRLITAEGSFFVFINYHHLAGLLALMTFWVFWNCRGNESIVGEEVC